MFKDLDPILHSQLRLAVMSLLISVKEADFTFIREKTTATAGNLSVQIQKLKEAGYIDVTKQFKENQHSNYPALYALVLEADSRPRWTAERIHLNRSDSRSIVPG